MATWAACVFDEIANTTIGRTAVSSAVDIRLLASGGEILTAGPTVTQLQITVLSDDENLAALRDALVRGTVADIALDGETVPSAQLVSIGTPVAVYQGDIWQLSLSFLADVEVVTPAIGVNIEGIGIPGVLSVSTSVGRNARFATATVNCTEPHGSRGQWVEIYGGAGGEIVALFKGQLDSISEDYYPGQATLNCTGTLKRLERQWHQLEQYTGQTDASMIVNLVEKRAGLHSIESSGWILGQRSDVFVQPGETFMQWVDALDEIARYRTYDRHDGAVYRRRDDPGAIGAASRTLSEGVNILSISLQENYDGIINDVIVLGLPMGLFQPRTHVQATSSALDSLMPETAPNYNTWRLTSDLIEDPVHCSEVANRIVSDLNRVQKALEITVPFDPTLVVDDTVLVNAPSIGVGATVMIWDVKHAVDGTGGTTTITTNTGTL